MPTNQVKYGKTPERQLNSVKAVDEAELLKSKDMNLSDLEDEELEDYFRLSNLCLLTNNGNTFGPYGSTDLLERKPVTISIENGNVLAQATCNFIYPDEEAKPIDFTNRKCFSFYVSFTYKRNRVHFYLKISQKSIIPSYAGSYGPMTPINTSLCDLEITKLWRTYP